PGRAHCGSLEWHFHVTLARVPGSAESRLMCGINGILYKDRQRQVDPALIDSMNKALLHRGPDEGGAHIDGSLGFGHRRLSIVDVASGQQPMCNEDGTVWITFNGEIYNYAALREELFEKGHLF